MRNATDFEALERRAQVEEFWAARGVYTDFMNAKRRADWEARKALLFECDMPISIPKMPPPAKAKKAVAAGDVVPLRSRASR